MLTKLFNHGDERCKLVFFPAPAVVASKCVEAVERNVSVFIFGPTHTPRPLPPRRAEEGANSRFGRVLKQGKYTHRGTLNCQKIIEICNLNSDGNLNLNFEFEVFRIRRNEEASSAAFGRIRAGVV